MPIRLLCDGGFDHTPILKFEGDTFRISVIKKINFPPYRNSFISDGFYAGFLISSKHRLFLAYIILDGTQSDSLDEILLEEWIRNEQRQDGYDGYGHTAR